MSQPSASRLNATVSAALALTLASCSMSETGNTTSTAATTTTPGDAGPGYVTDATAATGSAPDREVGSVVGDGCLGDRAHRQCGFAATEACDERRLVGLGGTVHGHRVTRRRQLR